MKVLHIVGDFGQGGIQTYVRDLLAQHSQYPDIESVVLLLYSKGPVLKSITDLGIAVHFIGMKGASDLRGLVHAIRLVRKLDCDVAHVHVVHPLIGPLLKVFGITAVYHEHGGILQPHGLILGGNFLSSRLATYTYKSYPKYIAISGLVKNFMGSRVTGILDRIVVIHNGTDTGSIEAVPPADRSTLPAEWPEDSFAVGIVGRLVPQKDVALFLDIAAELSKHHNNIVFPIVGDGRLRKELETRAQSLGLGKSVIFLGYREDAIAVMKRFDVILFTSAWEAFGLVVIEAMAAGVPIVAVQTRDSAVAEIIENGVSGYIAGNNDPVEISNSVSQLLGDKALRESFVEAGRKRVRAEFTMAVTASRVRQLYIDVVNKSG